METQLPPPKSPPLKSFASEVFDILALYKSDNQKRERSPFPIFGPRLLCPNGWMHQDATWCGGRPQPRRLCVRWGPSQLPKKGRSPQFSAHVYCGQTAAWIKMPLSTEVGLGLRDCVRWGPSSLSPKGAQPPPPIFGHVRCGQTAGWTKMPLGMEVGLGPDDFVFDGDPVTPRKKGTSTPPNFSPMSIVAKRMDG